MNEIKEVKAYEYNGQLFATKEEVITERKLFEARMRRVAPGVNLEMIGDRYNELDTQWKFELWLDRAALAQPSADEQYPPCDFCGVIPDHHPWHGSGMFKGYDNPHIHACNDCRHLLP